MNQPTTAINESERYTEVKKLLEMKKAEVAVMAKALKKASETIEALLNERFDSDSFNLPDGVIATGCNFTRNLQDFSQWHLDGVFVCDASKISELMTQMGDLVGRNNS